MKTPLVSASSLMFWLSNPALSIHTYIHNRIDLILLVEMEALNHWSVIECQIAIVCACLPTTRAFIVRFFPGVLGVPSGQAHPYRTTGSSKVAVGSSRPGGNSHISKTVSYSVDYGTKPQRRASNSFIQLVETGSERD